MPIVGMTDRGQAFPQIGHIRKGSEKQENKRGQKIWGTDLKYFRVEFDESEETTAALFQDRYGEEPAEIVVVMPFNDIDSFWEAWREAYVAGALWHRCNGVNINYQIDRDSGDVTIRNWRDGNGKQVPCTVQNHRDKEERCKPVGRLRVMIPELKRLAYLVVHTSSIHDIISISKQLAAIHSINGGSIVGIPLVMKRKPYEISTPSQENGKRVRREKWLISIEADPEWVAAKLDAMKFDALPEPRTLQIEQRAGDVYEGTGPDLEELEEYDEGDVIEEVEEPVLKATEKRPGNKGAIVAMDAKTWRTVADSFAKANPHYLDSSKEKGDYFHILRAAYAEGHDKVTEKNVRAVLEQVAQRQAIESDVETRID